MKNIFIDTNIIIDLLANRPPFGKFAVEIFDRAEKGTLKLYTSTHAFATTHYVLKKYIEDRTLRELLLSLSELVTLVPIDLAIIKKGLLSKHKDFEDALQIFAAHSVASIDFIVTRNLKDFKNAGIPVLPPDELMSFL